MELPVDFQLRELGWALALGAGLGLLYDGFRPLRRGRFFTAAADLLYSLLLLSALLLFSLYAGRGRLRVFALSFMASGFTLYWLTLGKAVRALCFTLGRAERKARQAIARALAAPVRTMARKIKKFLKK